MEEKTNKTPFGYVLLSNTSAGLYAGTTFDYKIAIRIDKIVRFEAFHVFICANNDSEVEDIRVNEDFDDICEALIKAQTNSFAFYPPVSTV